MSQIEKKLTEERMLSALKRLDQLLDQPVTLLLGGGGAMILAHKYPLATYDLDGFPVGVEFKVIDSLVKQIARELDLPGDWLNPWFSGFTHVLPADYRDRLVRVFKGKHLTAEALGREEMLLMKCFAHRQKDVGHAKALVKKKTDVKIVEKQIELLKSKKTLNAQEALDFLDDILDQVE